MGKLSLFVLGSITLAVVAILTLTLPEQRGESSFWIKILWLLFLVLLNWAASSFILFKGRDKNKSSIFGALPGLNITVFLCTLASGGLLIAYWDTPDSPYHLILQIISITICSVVVALALIAAKGAEITSLPEGAVSKEDLLRLIKRVETRFPADDLGNISEVRETLQYSTPHNSKIVLIPDYLNLCQLAMELENEEKIGGRTVELVEQMRVAARNCC